MLKQGFHLQHHLPYPAHTTMPSPPAHPHHPPKAAKAHKTPHKSHHWPTSHTQRTPIGLVYGGKTAD